MTSRHYLAPLLSIAAVFACTLASADAKDTTKTALLMIYKSRDIAFVNKNIAGALTPYATDVVLINADGNQSKGVSTPREELSKLFAEDVAFSSPETQVTDFAAGKTSHEATLKVTRSFTLAAKSGQGKPVVVEEVVRDHWVEDKNGWHITQERRLTNSTLLELCSTALAGPAKNKIVGKWVGYLPSRSGTAAQMTMEFREDGTELQMIAAPRQTISLVANYTAKDNVLTETLVSGTKNGMVTPNAGQVQTLRYRFEGDTLLIGLTGAGDELRFTRQPE